MRRLDLAEVLRELRHELPRGVVRDFEDGLIDELEAWDRLERLLGDRLERLLTRRGVELAAVDAAVLGFRRKSAGREAWTTFASPKEAHA